MPVEYIKKCVCGAKLGLWYPDKDAPQALRDAAPIKVCEPPLDEVVCGIPMPKEPCPKCHKWMDG